MTPEKMTPERMRPAIKFWDGQRWRFCPDCQRKAFEFAAKFAEHQRTEPDGADYWRQVAQKLSVVLAAYRATQDKESAELREWKKSILSALKYVPEWEPGKWAGDKEGWGFNFEFINWMRREIEKLRATQEEDAGKMTAEEFALKEGWISQAEIDKKLRWTVSGAFRFSEAYHQYRVSGEPGEDVLRLEIEREVDGRFIGEILNNGLLAYGATKIEAAVNVLNLLPSALGDGVGSQMLICKCGHQRGDHEGMGPSRGKPVLSACGACDCNQWRPTKSSIEMAWAKLEEIAVKGRIKERRKSAVLEGVEGESPTEKLKAGLASVGIGWIEPTDLRNMAGKFMLDRGVKMGVPLDPADVQTLLVDFAFTFALPAGVGE